MQSISENLQPFTGHCDVSKQVKKILKLDEKLKTNIVHTWGFNIKKYMKSVNFEETKIWNLTFDFQWRIRLPGFHANANRLKNQSFIQLVQGRRIFIFTNSGLTPLLNYPKTGHMTQVHIFSQEQLSV